MKANVAIVGGTFDPITVGHEALIRRTAELFEVVYVTICVNSEKKCFFDLNKRLEILKQTFKDDENIIPAIHEGLIADFAKEKNAVIIKGLRYSSDFDYEHLQAESNFMINGVETLFLPSRGDCTFITSSLIRELIKAGKSFEKYVPRKAFGTIESYIETGKNNHE